MTGQAQHLALGTADKRGSDQVYDSHGKEKPGKHDDGALYDLVAPSKNMSKPAGEWNHARILVNGNHVEHWLNGTKMLEYDLGSADFAAHVAASKFKNYRDFGKLSEGFIALQDHGDKVEFRNVRIKVLP